MTEPVPLGPLPADPLVSVIIPCYNQGRFLPEAIESALLQTYPRVEIVVVDDGSTDNTSAVATSSKHVRYIRQENTGPSLARNRGLQEAAGKCLVFLDADDRVRPRAVELGLRHLKHCPHAAFSYGRCDLIAADGSFLGPSERPIVDGDHYLRLLSANFLPNPAAIMFRREALAAVGGFRFETPGVEDYDLCLRLTRIYRACGFHDVIADYRQHGASLSRNAALMSDSVLTVLRSQREYVSGNRTYEQALREGMRNWRRRYYAELLVARTRENARAGRWCVVLRDVASLLRSNPRIALENARRKLRAGWLSSGTSR